MGFWIHLRWVGKGLQIASTIVGGGISYLLIQTPQAWVKPFVVALLWSLAIGFILDLCYEIHQLQENQQNHGD